MSVLAALVVSTLVNVEIKVMTYNIWVGGTRHQPLSQTVEAIRASGADIVGIQEPGSNLDDIANALGWNYSSQSAIISRFPILEEWDVQGARWGGTRIQTPDDEILYVYNTHLTAYPYGPYEIRDKNATTQAEIDQVEINSGRVPEVKRMLADIQTRVSRNARVVFTGDFNAPSHLDWTKDTAKRTFGISVAWPVSTGVKGAGFVDTYRFLNPSPIRKPGFTWSPGYPVPNIADDDVMDRIDFVYSKGQGLTPVLSQIVAETGPITDIAVDPWPSDHRAVVTTFRLD